MAYWQVRAKLNDIDYIPEFVAENRWELLNKEDKESGLYANTINSIQEGELIFLANEDKLEYYARCIENHLDGTHIRVDKWKKFDTSLNISNKINVRKDILLIRNIKNLERRLKAIDSTNSLLVYKIKELSITNFRLIKKMKIDFNEDVNVIIANNGAGKTTLLDAIAIGFGSMLTHFPNVNGISFTSNNIDLHINERNKKEPFMRLELTSTQNVKWDRVERRDQSKSTIKLIPNRYGQRELKIFIDNIIDFENEDKIYTMPLIMYYGTCRNCFDAPMRKTNFKKEFNRFEALDGSLKSSTNFNRLFQWFNAMEDLERREIQNQKNFDFELPELKNVRDAITSMLKGFKNPRIENRPLRFMIDRVEEDGTIRKLQIEQLSDGYKAVLAMVMDISARMSEGNPHLGNNSEAIILIDELDLHLHPKWQQTILSDLRRTFPNAQFIVTTHSVHILSSIKKEKLFILRDGKIEKTHLNTYGKSIDELLLGSFGVESLRYPEVANKIEYLQKYIYSDDYIEELFFSKLEALEKDIGKDDIAVLKLRLEKLKRDKNA